MGRYFALAVLCLAVLGGIGYFVRARMAGSSSATTVTPRDAGLSHAVAAADATAPRTVVVEVKGTVERRSGDRWVAVAVGDALDARDALRTTEGGTARIDVGGKIVQLDDRTEITVGEISATVSSIVLAEGRVSANGTADGRVIRIATRDTIAEAQDGKFDVLASSDGHVTVAAETGAVKLTAHGASVDVHAGEQSSVDPGAAPMQPTRIPSSLFLKVNSARGARDKVASLHGETAPGAIVSINGVRTVAADTGEFDTKVPLKEGANVIIVSVEDASGRHQQKVIKRDLDTRGPKLHTEVDWK
jgi:hypothetical protein